MRRPRTLALAAVGLVVFLAISFELARFLSAPNDERDAVYGLLEDQARGDTRGVADALEDCDAACRAQVARIVARVKRPGEPKILSYESKTGYALGTKTGRGRVAWAIVARDGFPVVQCVTVRRSWSFVSGASISLTRLSAPIGNEQGC